MGIRLRPISDDRPKPLVELCGRPLIDWVLDRIRAAGIGRIVVNTHYRADMLQRHLSGQSDITISHEDTLLETGGGVKEALPMLGKDPFLVVNADAVWLDGPSPALARLIDAWRPADMDALLMLQPTSWVTGYQGPGDYFLDPLGLARRRQELEVAPLLYAGAHILHPRALNGTPEGAFSMNIVFDALEARDRLWGMVHDGVWYHIGTPGELESATDEITRGHTAVVSR